MHEETIYYNGCFTDIYFVIVLNSLTIEYLVFSGIKQQFSTTLEQDAVEICYLRAETKGK